MIATSPDPAPAAASANGRSLRDAWWRRLRLVGVVLVLGFYALIAPVGYATFWLFCVVRTRDPAARARRLQWITANAFRVLFDTMWLFRIVRFEHRRRLAHLPERPFVVVANHPTLLDVAAITALLGGGCSITKPQLFLRRGLRTLLVGAGHVPGSGADRLATGRVVDEAVLRLRQGFVVIVFPEGTRSPVVGMHAFGRAAFEIACRARVPVVSLQIGCEPRWLSKEVGFLDVQHPMPHLEIEVLAADDPAALDFDSRLLKHRVESRYRQSPVATCQSVGREVAGGSARVER